MLLMATEEPLISLVAELKDSVGKAVIAKALEQAIGQALEQAIGQAAEQVLDPVVARAHDRAAAGAQGLVLVVAPEPDPVVAADLARAIGPAAQTESVTARFRPAPGVAVMPSAAAAAAVTAVTQLA